MSKALTVGFFLLLYFATVWLVGALKCFKCENVAEDNTCSTPERKCDYGLLNFCYTRVIIKGNVMVKVDRGCLGLCFNMKRKKDQYEERMLCCTKELCNTHNYWSND